MDTIPESRQFDLGRVLQDVWRGTVADYGAYLVLGVCVWIPMLFALEWLSPISQYRIGADPASMPSPSARDFAIHFGLMLVTYYVILMFHGTVMRAGFGRLRGKPTGVGPALRHVLSRQFVLVTVALVVAVGGMVGLFLCVIPGVFLLVALFPVMAVTVCEPVGIFDALNRAWDLTEGYRWWIFALGFIVGMINLVLSMSIMPLIFLASPAVLALANGTLAILVQPFYAMVSVACYVHLRRLHDNLDVEDVAEVFA